MSSFYDDASLVVIPSGYKTSKVYAEKPTDGSGDLAFTRTGDTATRVNSAGIIEKVRTNLLTYSQDVTNAAWTKSATNASANTTTAPDGTTTADTITETATSAQHAFFNSFTTGASIATFSVYLKANGRNFATIYPQGTSMAGYATVDLSNGTINTTGGSTFLRAAIESAGNGWYRIQVALTTTANSLACVVYLSNTLGGVSPTYLGDGTSGVFVWGTQLETGDIATPYIPTTTAAVSVGPVANVPRLDYLGSTCPRLLLEPQRTNLVFYSEQFNNAYWGKLNATVDSNVTTSPDGYTNADRLKDDAVSGSHYAASSAITVTNATQYTFTAYLKADTLTWVRLELFSGGCFFNLSNGTLGTASGATATITSVGNGWYRCSVMATSASTTAYPAIRLTTGNGVFGYAGNGSGLFVWGAQLEAGAYATSYIPTLAASATRGADACSKTGISSLIGQTEGTIFIDFKLNQAPSDANGRLLQLWATNDTTNAIIPILNQSLQLQITTFGASAGSAIITAGPSTLLGLGQNKIAVAYTSTSVVVYRNGILFASGNPTGFFPASLTSLDLGGSSFAARNLGNPINQALLFPTRLTNAQLAELTTL